MKRILFLVYILFLTPVLAGNIFVEWSDPIKISGGGYPDFDINRETGDLHIVTIVGEVVYTKTDYLGNILQQEVVPGSEADDSLIGKATIAVDQNGYPHITFIDRLRKWFPKNYYYNIYYTMKSNFGWLSPVPLSENIYRGYVVRMAIDENNRAHVVNAIGNVNDEPYATVSYHRIMNGLVEKTQEGIGPFRVDNDMEIDVSSDGLVHLVLGFPDPYGRILYYKVKSGKDEFTKVKELQTWQNKGRTGGPDIYADTSGNVHFCYGTLTDFSRNWTPAVRYVKFVGNSMVQDIAVTSEGELDNSWKPTNNGWGLGSVASSADGQYVAVAYVDKDIGDLKVTLSTDGGGTWEYGKIVDSNVGGHHGRCKHVLRARGNYYYLLYSIWPDTAVNLCIFRFGNFPPDADANGPYSGLEGSPIEFDGSNSIDRGDSSGIALYEWDFQNDGIYDFSDSVPTASYTYPDDYNGMAALRVTDITDQTDVDVVSIEIANVAPQVDIGNDVLCDEGDTLLFNCAVIDPGQDSHSFIWNFGDGTFSTKQNPTNIYFDEDTVTVKVTVSDDDGGVDHDSIMVSILNVAPVANAGGPYRSYMGAEVSFIGSGYDPGLNDQLTYSWDLDFDGLFESEGQVVSKIFNEDALYIIQLQVSDDDGGIDVDLDTLIVSTKPPSISPINVTPIDEGGVFDPILLDDHVEDPDDSDETLIWSHSGNQELMAAIQFRTLFVATPDSEWSGSETLTLVVMDPAQLYDSIDVVFTVNPINDPPVWKSEIPELTFKEDDTLTLSFSYFRSLVMDIDNDTSELTFSVTGSGLIHAISDTLNEKFHLFASENWYGFETFQFMVIDKSGDFGLTDGVVIVTPEEDPPGSFDLIEPVYLTSEEWPDSILFCWQRSIDPDPESTVFYEWRLEKQNGEPHSNLFEIVFDTTYLWFPDKNMDQGIYFWHIIAYDDNENQRESNSGILRIGTITGLTLINETPKEFRLLQNFPNPFNPFTQIMFHLPSGCRIHLAVYNGLGQEVRVLEEGYFKAGVYRFTWDGRDQMGRRVETGIYFYRLKTASKIFIKKMMLIQ